MLLFSIAMRLNNDHLIVLRLCVILIFTINAGRFELYPTIDYVLNSNRFVQLVSLYILCLSFITSVEKGFKWSDAINALIATGLFVLIARPREINNPSQEASLGSYYDDITNKRSWLG